MSALYGTVIGQARTAANRRGSREITAAVRSWDGSVTVTMRKSTKDSSPEVSIEVSEGSKIGGRTVWRGSLASLMLQGLIKAQSETCEHSVPLAQICTSCDPRYQDSGQTRVGR